MGEFRLAISEADIVDCITWDTRYRSYSDRR